MKKAFLSLALLASACAHAGVTLQVTTTIKGESLIDTVTLEENQSVKVVDEEGVSVEIEAKRNENDEVTIRCVICQILQGQSQVVAEEEQTVADNENAEFKCPCSSGHATVVVQPRPGR